MSENNISSWDIEQQIKLEEEHFSKGILKAQLEVKDKLESEELHRIPAIQRFIKNNFELMTQEIEAEKNAASTGSLASQRKFLRQVDTGVLAIMALTQIVNLLSRKDTHVTTAAAKLGRLIHSEILINKCRSVARSYTDKVQEQLERTKVKNAEKIYRCYATAAKDLATREEIIANEAVLSGNDSVRLGMLLLRCMVNTGAIEIKTESIGKRGKRKAKIVVPSPELEELLVQLMESLSAYVSGPPMIVPPAPHENIFFGGYLTNNFDRISTLANSNLTKEELKRVNEHFKGSEVQAALNKLQSVAYRVNTKVHTLVNQARAMGIGLGFPSTKPERKPTFPIENFDIDNASDEEQEQFTEWKAQAKLWYEREKQRKAKLAGLINTFTICNKYAKTPRLFFPTKLDWRYRIYFKSVFNPQGTDVTKALIEFADGKPLGPTGLFWLKVHIANCYGYDKTTFKDREMWTTNNYEFIYRLVKSPFDHLDFWKNADAPWCFMAACIELVDAIESGQPEQYISHCIVSMDATNSGGQHYSALLCDPMGAKVCNLVNSGTGKKADLYQEVADLTNRKINRDYVSKIDYLGKGIHYFATNNVTRKMAKRPTMTYFYSATLESAKNYIYEEMLDSDAKPKDNPMKICHYIAKCMRESIQDAMPSAAIGMKYLISLAKSIPDDSKLSWVTPAGGLVINAYPKESRSSVKVFSMNLKQVVSFKKDYSKTSIRRAASGIAPNFIHSMDAAHLVKVALAFYGSLVPIHDSFGTHAADVSALHTTIRAEFVKMYKGSNILNHLKDQAIAAGAKAEDIKVPEKGNFDLNQVLNSELFFC